MPFAASDLRIAPRMIRDSKHHVKPNGSEGHGWQRKVGCSFVHSVCLELYRLPVEDTVLSACSSVFDHWLMIYIEYCGFYRKVWQTLR